MGIRTLALKHTDRSVSTGLAFLPRLGILAFGLASYVVGVAALVAVMLPGLGISAFTGGPIHIGTPLGAALFNLGLVVLFGLQHSVMARAPFKERLTRVLHPSMERSVYLLATSAVLLPMVILWQPLPAVLWSLGSPPVRAALNGVALLGWAYLFVATFAIDHFELFGLQQSWLGFRGQPPVPVAFRERWMYRFDRHPIMTGLLVGLWATPDMTLGYLLFAAGLSAYAVVGVHFEERALERQLGEVYRSYRRRVRALVPTIGSRRAARPLRVTTHIAAPPERAWALLSDVTRWPEWLPTMTAVEPLGPSALTPGARYRITQPRLRPAIWTVVRLEAPGGFSWESRSPGVRVLADHSLRLMPDGSTSATLEIRFSGPLSGLARAVGGSLARDYLAREAALLRQRVEAQP